VCVFVCVCVCVCLCVLQEGLETNGKSGGRVTLAKDLL
jgi:hypothetical protein